jgi:Flp pilus assembly protein TadG
MTSGFLRSFLRNQDGVAATEFALISPILVLLFLGVVELSNLLIADAKLRAVTSSVSDLVTQDVDGAISTSDISLMNEAAAQIMFPMPTAPLQLTIVDYQIDTSDSSVSVRWKRQLDPPAAPVEPATPACADGTGLPSGLVADTFNDVVRVDGTYAYTPILLFFAGKWGVLNLSTTSFNMPRYSLTLVPDTGFSTSCP